MSAIIDAVKSNPVRTYIYGVLVAVLGALVAFGVIDADTADVLTGVVATVLVVGATEKARSKVTPV